MQSMVRFVAHVDEIRRPPGFPTKVYFDTFHDDADRINIKDFIKSVYQIFVAQNCIITPKDSAAIQDEQNFNYDKMMFVSLGMITHITTETKRLVTPIPTADEYGNLQLLDGKKAWRQ